MDVKPWTERLERHSLSWIGAFFDEQLVGFVHACWDGGAHAFLLDTAVDPDRQRSGIGARLVQALVDETTAAGCDWLHVDYEPHLASFYTEACGVQLDLRGPPQTRVWVSPILINRCRRKQSDTDPVEDGRILAVIATAGRR